MPMEEKYVFLTFEKEISMGARVAGIKWFDFEEIIDEMKPKECAITIKEDKLFHLYGQYINALNGENMILCRMVGAEQMKKENQDVVSFCKL